MSFARYKLLIDWSNNGDFEHDAIARGLGAGPIGVLENVTAYLLMAHPLSWSMGRDYPSQLVGKSIAGHLSCTLDNRDGRFNRFNTASPLYGYIRPGRKVQLRASFGGVTYILWTGWLDNIDAQPALHPGHVAQLTAYGSLERVNKDNIKVAMQTAITTGEAVDVLLDRIGWPAGLREIDAGQTEMDRWWIGGLVGLSALREVEETEAGFLRETKLGKIAFENRHHRLTTPHTLSQAVFSDAAGASISYQGIEQGDPVKELFNIISVPVTVYTVEALQDIWTLAEVPSIAAGQSRTFWTQLPPDSNLVAIDAWTTPVATTDHLANSQADGLGSNLTGNIAVTVSKLDTAMKITLTNNAAVEAHITLLKARGTPVVASDPVIIKAEDATSQVEFGEREYKLPAPWLADTGEAQDRADFELSIRKDPIAVLPVTIIGNRDGAAMTQVLQRDVSDRVSVVADNQTKLGIDSDYFIEAMHHSVTNGVHTCTFECSPADGYSGFMVLDVGPALDIGRLGY